MKNIKILYIDNFDLIQISFDLKSLIQFHFRAVLGSEQKFEAQISPPPSFPHPPQSSLLSKSEPVFTHGISYLSPHLDSKHDGDNLRLERLILAKSVRGEVIYHDRKCEAAGHVAAESKQKETNSGIHPAFSFSCSYSVYAMVPPTVRVFSPHFRSLETQRQTQRYVS